MPQTDPHLRCQRCSCAIGVTVDGKPYCGMCRGFTPYIVMKRDASCRLVRRYHDAETDPYGQGHGYFRSAKFRSAFGLLLILVLGFTALILVLAFGPRP